MDLKANELHVRQRADDKPKSEAGERTVHFGPYLASTLKKWKLGCPHGELMFPNGNGGIETLANIRQRGFIPAVPAALGSAKYTGMHAFRPFYVSWLIDRGMPPKLTRERLGHLSITMTFHRYRHLSPRVDDRREIEAAELAVVNATQLRHAG